MGAGLMAVNDVWGNSFGASFDPSWATAQASSGFDGSYDAWGGSFSDNFGDSFGPTDAVVTPTSTSLFDDIREDLAEIVRCDDELAQSITIGGRAVKVLLNSDYRGAIFDQYEVSSYDTRFNAVTSDLTTAGAQIGTAVTYNNSSYVIDKLEPNRDTGLTLVYLKLSN